MSVMLLASLLMATQLGAFADTVRLDRLDGTRPGEPLPPGWQLRGVSGEEPPLSGVAWHETGPAMVLTAPGAAGQCWLELGEPLDPSAGVLRWRWRVGAQLPDVDLRVPELDDAPGRFFVVFGRPGLFSRPRMIFYTWGGLEPIGDAFFSHVSDRLAVVVVRNAMDPSGVWHEETRDVAADFREVFGEEPGQITSVGLMVDTDQTGAWASVELSAAEWLVRRSASP